MKNLTKLMIALLAILVVLPAGLGANTLDKKKDKKKKPFKWELPATLSGNKDVDEYLLSCDTLWTRIQSYTENMTTYEYKEDTLWNINGSNYVVAHMENDKGEYLTRGAVNWQLVEAVTTGVNIVLDATNLGLQTALATASLPSLGLKAISFAKYIKAGPVIIGKGGKEIKELATLRRSQYQSWKALKKGAIDAETLGIWNEKQLADLKKCCFVKKLDITTSRELTDAEKAAQEKLTGSLDITVAPELEGQSLDKDMEDLDIDAMIEAEEKKA